MKKVIKMKKKHILILAISLILLSIFTFKDLEIAKFLNNDKSIFGLFYEVIGEMPVYFGVLLFGVTMFNLVKKESSKILAILITIIGSLLFVIMPARYLPFFNGLMVFILSIITIILSVLLLLLSRKLSKEFYNKILPLACVYFITCCLAPALVFAIKTFVGRVRFEDLNTSFSNYTRWYVINGITGNYSFPSGHTVSATTIICLNNLPKCIQLSKKQKITLYSLTSIHIGATAFSRMILGRHYGSDVLMAFLICYAVKEISTAMFFKHRQDKKFRL